MMAGPAGSSTMEGQEQAADAGRRSPIAIARRSSCGDVARPEAGGGGRKHHHPDRQQRAERVEAADEVEDHEAEEGQMGRRLRRG